MIFNHSDNKDNKKIYIVFALSFLFGCLIKTYDEIIDNKLNVSIFYTENINIKF